MRPSPDEDEATRVAVDFTRRQIRWSARRHFGDGRLHISAASAVDVGDLDDYSGFHDGWTIPDAGGIWTKGARAELALAIDVSDGGAAVALLVDGVCVEPGGSISVEVLVDGEPAAARAFSDKTLIGLPTLRPFPPRVVRAAKTILPDALTDRLYPLYWRLTTPAALRAGSGDLGGPTWRIELPGRVAAGRTANLTFLIDEPRTPLRVGWSDDQRELGFHIHSLTLEHVDREGSERASEQRATRV